MSIKGYCHTNLDNYDCSGVTQFVAVPRLGEKVQVRYLGRDVTLKVVEVKLN
jgi:hypothetical protein